MIPEEPLRITQSVAQVFESLGIRYFIGGSLASSLYGIPRATHDVDIVADVAIRHIPEMVKALSPSFYIDAEMIHEAIIFQRSFNLIHLDTMLKIDIFILKPDSVSQEEMSRRQRYSLFENPEETLYMTSAEDIIVQKLVWYRLGGDVQDRQWMDVLGVLQVRQSDLDYAYLERAAELRNVALLLKQAIAEAREIIE